MSSDQKEANRWPIVVDSDCSYDKTVMRKRFHEPLILDIVLGLSKYLNSLLLQSGLSEPMQTNSEMII